VLPPRADAVRLLPLVPYVNSTCNIVKVTSEIGAFNKEDHGLSLTERYVGQYLSAINYVGSGVLIYGDGNWVLNKVDGRKI
jgi:hypothetical protein